jgi:hypothetical protein
MLNESPIYYKIGRLKLVQAFSKIFFAKTGIYIGKKMYIEAKPQKLIKSVIMNNKAVNWNNIFREFAIDVVV